MAIELAPTPASVSQARAFVVREVSRRRMEVEREIAELLTSELVTNAVRHATTPIVLAVGERNGALRVDVHDRSADPPQQRDGIAADAERGRGLQIVAACADRWGYELDEDGKYVWFELET